MFFTINSQCQGGRVWLAASGDSCRLLLSGRQLWLCPWIAAGWVFTVEGRLMLVSSKAVIKNTASETMSEIDSQQAFWDGAITDLSVLGFSSVHWILCWGMEFAVMKESQGYLCPLKTKLDGSLEWLILNVKLKISRIVLDITSGHNRRRLSWLG